ncbi:MAG: 2'-5' RNA ligase family protein [Ramlibacter sp.]
MKNLLLMLFPTPQVRDLLDVYRRRCPFPRGHRLPDADRLHLTLFSLGLVPDGRVQGLRDMLRDVPMEPLELWLYRPVKLTGVASMPVRSSRTLKQFRECLRAALEAGGFAHEGGNRPHVSLAYQSATEAPAPPTCDIPWMVREFKLVWSQLPPAFAWGRHVVLERYPAQIPLQQRLFD